MIQSKILQVILLTIVTISVIFLSASMELNNNVNSNLKIASSDTVKNRQNKCVENITLEEIQDHMFYLSSDFMGGRVTGTQEYLNAAYYAVSQFMRAGLEPIKPFSNEVNKYLQTVPLEQRGYFSDSKIRIEKDNSILELESGVDFKLVSAKNNIELLRTPQDAVFVGYGIEEPGNGWNDLEGLDIKGKWVVALIDIPTKDGKPLLSLNLQNKYEGKEGFQRKHKALVNKGPIAIIYIMKEELYNNYPNIIDKNGLYLFNNSKLEQNTQQTSVIVIPLEKAGIIFKDQSYSPIFPESNQSAYKTYKMQGIKIGFNLKPSNKKVISYNVLGIVNGADEKLKNEYIIISAHLDHIASTNGEIYNGADDNASGCTAVMEIAEAVAASSPLRSVVFVLFTGEDIGEYRMGSRFFLDNCPIDKNKIIANINLDMIGRTDSYWPEGPGYFIMDSETVSSDFRSIIINVNENTMKLPISFHTSTSGTSDHKSFSDTGIPSAGLFSGAHKDLHKPSDKIDKISFNKIEQFAQLAYYLAMDLANRERNPDHLKTINKNIHKDKPE